MESLIETFRIDARLLIAQTINFAIVFIVLYFFLLKPLFKTMKDRSKTIEKSLEDAERVKDRLSQAEADYDRKMVEAKKQANKIVEASREQAENKKQEMIQKAKAEIGALINQEKDNMQAEKAKTLKEIKREVADLVAASLEKILEKKLDPKEDAEIIKKIIK